MNELTNLLNRRNNSSLSISELANKKTKSYTKPDIKKLEIIDYKPYDNILEELKAKIKIYK